VCVRSQGFRDGERVDTIGESISLVNTGENLVSKDSLDRGDALCYMQREFHPTTDDGFCERFITPSGARPYSASQARIRCIFQFSFSLFE